MTAEPVFCFFLICMLLELTFARMEEGRAVACAAAAEPEVSLSSEALSSLFSFSRPARMAVLVWTWDALRFFVTMSELVVDAELCDDLLRWLPILV